MSVIIAETKERIDNLITKSIKDFVILTKQLSEMDDIPNSYTRDLMDRGVQRLMTPDQKKVTSLIADLIETIGYETKYRLAARTVAERQGFVIKFAPCEQDSFGWLTAKLMTNKGVFYYG